MANLKKITVISMLLMVTTIFIYGCGDDGSDIVNGPDNPELYAYFSAERQSVKEGGTIQFEDKSLGNPTSWNWTFESGTPSSSTQQNPAVTYDTKGEFEVTLEIYTDNDTTSRMEEEYVTVISNLFLSKNILASFLFYGSAQDTGPNELETEIVGDGEITFDGTDRNGNENSAAVFSGSALLTVADDPALNFDESDFSVSFWLKTSTQQQMMVWQESGSQGAGDNQAWFRLRDNNSEQFFVVDNAGRNFLSGELDIMNDQWHHIVCVRENVQGGTNSRVYVDGELVLDSTGNSVDIDVSNEADFKIGGQESGDDYTNFYSGMLDDFVVYDKALTDQEVNGLYNFDF